MSFRGTVHGTGDSPRPRGRARICRRNLIMILPESIWISLSESNRTSQPDHQPETHSSGLVLAMQPATRPRRVPASLNLRVAGLAIEGISGGGEQTYTKGMREAAKGMQWKSMTKRDQRDVRYICRTHIDLRIRFPGTSAIVGFSQAGDSDVRISSVTIFYGQRSA